MIAPRNCPGHRGNLRIGTRTRGFQRKHKTSLGSETYQPARVGSSESNTLTLFPSPDFRTSCIMKTEQRSDPPVALWLHSAKAHSALSWAHPKPSSLCPQPLDKHNCLVKPVQWVADLTMAGWEALGSGATKSRKLASRTGLESASRHLHIVEGVCRVGV